MKFAWLLLASVVLALLGCKQHQPAARPAANVGDAVFIQTFTGNCVLAIRDFDRVEANARVMRWARVTNPDQLKMIAPADHGGHWKSWLFKINGKGFGASVGRTRVGTLGTVSLR